MPRPCLPVALVLPLMLAGAARAEEPAPAPGVTIYRCVAADGAVALRDSPCRKGERQEVRSMQRPQDPPPAPAPPAAPAQATAPPPERERERIVYRTPPRPMYECVTPDGETYTSENGEGNLRWVPYWSVGYPVGAWPRGGASVSGNLSFGRGNLSFHSGDPPPPPRPPGPPHPHPPHRPGILLPAGGAWVRDECHALPQQEVCARLSDRRYEILRRYGSAMPSERRALDLEQRGIDARIANDCTNP